MTRPRAARATRVSAIATALSVGWLLGVVGAAPASAHASLVRSSPVDQSSMAAAPTTVTLTFDENIRMPSVILVTDADGASVVQGKTSVVDTLNGGAADIFELMTRAGRKTGKLPELK